MFSFTDRLKAVLGSAEAATPESAQELNLAAAGDPPSGTPNFAQQALQGVRNRGLAGGLLPAAAESSGRVAGKKKQWSDEELFEFRDSQGIKSGKFPKKHLEGVIRAAQAVGEDPYEAAAFVLQESSLGLDGDRNLGYTYQDLSEDQVKEMTELSQKTGIDMRYLEPLILFRDKTREGKRLGFAERAKQIQVYNGMGTLTKKMVNGADRAYGVPIGDGIDMRQNPLYGKRVLALAEDMRRNAYLQSLLGGQQIASR
jgi:hypothetical protein